MLLDGQLGQYRDALGKQARTSMHLSRDFAAPAADAAAPDALVAVEIPAEEEQPKKRGGELALSLVRGLRSIEHHS